MLRPPWGAVVAVIVCEISVDHHYSCEFESRSWRDVFDTTLCDDVCQWLATGWWFSSVSSRNETDRYNWYIVESGVKHHNPNHYDHRGLIFEITANLVSKRYEFSKYNLDELEYNYLTIKWEKNYTVRTVSNFNQNIIDTLSKSMKLLY